MLRVIRIAVVLAAALAVVFLAGRSTAQVHRGSGTRLQPKHIRIDAARIAAMDDVMELIEPGPFTRAQRLVNAIQWYRAEVNNGGHSQFYGNSTGIVWRDALAGFELLGLSKLADNLRESAERLGGDPPLDRQQREALLERLNPDFTEITERFWELERRTGVDAVVLQYARAHPEEFEFDGVLHMPTSEDAVFTQYMIWVFP